MQKENQSILGSWLLVSSEVPTLEPYSEIYQFLESGRFNMWYPNGVGGAAVTMMFFSLEKGVVFYGQRRNLSHQIIVSFDGDEMILLASHGMESYFRILREEVMPDWADGARIPTV